MVGYLRVTDILTRLDEGLNIIRLGIAARKSWKLKTVSKSWETLRIFHFLH